jgi:hypothetical protein
MVESLKIYYENMIEVMIFILRPILDPIANVLLYPGEFFRELILAIPLSGARIIFIVYPILLFVWVILFKKDELKGKLHLFGDRTIDIRPIAFISLFGQVLIYYFF